METVSKDGTEAEVVCKQDGIRIDAETFLREAKVRMKKRLAMLRGEDGDALSFSHQLSYSRQ